MAINPAMISVLAAPLKDLYENGKSGVQKQLAKLQNARTIESLVSKVAAYEHVKTIWKLGKTVKLSNFYYPSKVILANDVIKSVLSLRDLPRHNLVIQGTVGQGKSIFLRYLCVKELTDQSSGRIPVFFELRKLDKSLNIEDALSKILSSLGFEISDELIDYYASSGKLVILLDGFDEIDESLVSQVITWLELWSIKYPQLQFIVTSRPCGEIQKSNSFEVLRLAPLTHEDLNPFLSKIGVKVETKTNLLTAINQSPSAIKEFLNTPLLLTLLVLVYQSEGSIPNELPEFFKLLFTTVFTRHDGTKPAFTRAHKSGLNERRLEHLFEAFCFAILRRKFTVNLKLEQFEVSFEDALKFSGEKCELKDFKEDLIKVACLLQEDGIFITFAHKSLLDFYPAAFIKNRSEPQAVKIYNSILKDHVNWRPTLNFLEHIDKFRFISYFQIPEIENLLNQYNIIDYKVTDENIDYIIQMIFGRAKAEYKKNEVTGTFTNGMFGPYNPPQIFTCQNSIDFIYRPLVPNELHDPNKYEAKLNENGIELITLDWADICKGKELLQLKIELKSYFEALINILNESKEYVENESLKGDLLALLDIDSI